MSEAQWQRQLSQGLAGMDMALDEQQQQRLLDFLALLNKWNRAYNLTAVREPAEMVSRQLLDSLRTPKMNPRMVASTMPKAATSAVLRMPTNIARR